MEKRNVRFRNKFTGSSYYVIFSNKLQLVMVIHLNAERSKSILLTSCLFEDENVKLPWTGFFLLKTDQYIIFLTCRSCKKKPLPIEISQILQLSNLNIPKITVSYCVIKVWRLNFNYAERDLLILMYKSKIISECPVMCGFFWLRHYLNDFLCNMQIKIN